MKLLHLKRRFYEALCGLPQSMKHILCLRALLVKHQNIWSGTACHEAKPFQALCFFAHWGKKSGNSHFFHFLIIRSVSGVLHIVKCNGTMLHSEMKWSCFIWKGVFMKHILCLRALLVKHQNIWSAPSVHEAKPFQASFTIFAAGKNGGRWGTRTPDIHGVNVTL